LWGDVNKVLDHDRLPRHVAIIMDGNGRWAQRRGLTRIEGHKRGKDAVRAVVEASRDLDLEYLTLYAFSTENWQRPPTEVRALMGLLHRYLRTELQRMMKRNIRLRAVGDLDRLPGTVRRALEHVIHETRNNTGLTVILALSYGGREEIVAAARTLALAVQEGRLKPEEIDQACFAQHLWTADIPDPDLLIRTSGEYRLSNFLLWQLVYTELYVTNTLWPDFTREEFLQALADYQNRERRFGRTTDQQSPPELKRAAR
jgi:undecaprenyl diphosphate synthase